MMLELQLAALRCGAAWDPAGRLLFPDHRPAIAYAHAVAAHRKARQRVHRLHATPLLARRGSRCGRESLRARYRDRAP